MMYTGKNPYITVKGRHTFTSYVPQVVTVKSINEKLLQIVFDDLCGIERSVAFTFNQCFINSKKVPVEEFGQCLVDRMKILGKSNPILAQVIDRGGGEFQTVSVFTGLNPDPPSQESEPLHPFVGYTSKPLLQNRMVTTTDSISPSSVFTIGKLASNEEVAINPQTLFIDGIPIKYKSDNPNVTAGQSLNCNLVAMPDHLKKSQNLENCTYMTSLAWLGEKPRQDKVQEYVKILENTRKGRVVLLCYDETGVATSGLIELYKFSNKDDDLKSNLRVWFDRQDAYLYGTCIGNTDLSIFFSGYSEVNVYFQEEQPPLSALEALGQFFCGTDGFHFVKAKFVTKGSVLPEDLYHVDHKNRFEVKSSAAFNGHLKAKYNLLFTEFCSLIQPKSSLMKTCNEGIVVALVGPKGGDVVTTIILELYSGFFVGVERDSIYIFGYSLKDANLMDLIKPPLKFNIQLEELNSGEIRVSKAWIGPTPTKEVIESPPDPLKNSEFMGWLKKHCSVASKTTFLRFVNGKKPVTSFFPSRLGKPPTSYSANIYRISTVDPTYGLLKIQQGPLRGEIVVFSATDLFIRNYNLAFCTDLNTVVRTGESFSIEIRRCLNVETMKMAKLFPVLKGSNEVSIAPNFTATIMYILKRPMPSVCTYFKVLTEAKVNIDFKNWLESRKITVEAFVSLVNGQTNSAPVKSDGNLGRVSVESQIQVQTTKNITTPIQSVQDPANTSTQKMENTSSSADQTIKLASHANPNQNIQTTQFSATNVNDMANKIIQRVVGCTSPNDPKISTVIQNEEEFVLASRISENLISALNLYRSTNDPKTSGKPVSLPIQSETVSSGTNQDVIVTETHQPSKRFPNTAEIHRRPNVIVPQNRSDQLNTKGGINTRPDHKINQSTVSNPFSTRIVANYSNVLKDTKKATEISRSQIGQFDLEHLSESDPSRVACPTNPGQIKINFKDSTRPYTASIAKTVQTDAKQKASSPMDRWSRNNESNQTANIPVNESWMSKQNLRESGTNFPQAKDLLLKDSFGNPESSNQYITATKKSDLNLFESLKNEAVYLNKPMDENNRPPSVEIISLFPSSKPLSNPFVPTSHSFDPSMDQYRLKQKPTSSFEDFDFKIGMQKEQDLDLDTIPLMLPAHRSAVGKSNIISSEVNRDRSRKRSGSPIDQVPSKMVASDKADKILDSISMDLKLGKFGDLVERRHHHQEVILEESYIGSGRNLPVNVNTEKRSERPKGILKNSARRSEEPVPSGSIKYDAIGSREPFDYNAKLSNNVSKPSTSKLFIDISKDFESSPTESPSANIQRDAKQSIFREVENAKVFLDNLSSSKSDRSRINQSSSADGASRGILRNSYDDYDRIGGSRHSARDNYEKTAIDHLSSFKEHTMSEIKYGRSPPRSDEIMNEPNIFKHKYDKETSGESYNQRINKSGLKSFESRHETNFSNVDEDVPTSNKYSKWWDSKLPEDHPAKKYSRSDEKPDLKIKFGSQKTEGEPSGRNCDYLRADREDAYLSERAKYLTDEKWRERSEDRTRDLKSRETEKWNDRYNFDSNEKFGYESKHRSRSPAQLQQSSSWKIIDERSSYKSRDRSPVGRSHYHDLKEEKFGSRPEESRYMARSPDQIRSRHDQDDQSTDHDRRRRMPSPDRIRSTRSDRFEEEERKYLRN